MSDQDKILGTALEPDWKRRPLLERRTFDVSALPVSPTIGDEVQIPGYGLVYVSVASSDYDPILEIVVESLEGIRSSCYLRRGERLTVAEGFRRVFVASATAGQNGLADFIIERQPESRYGARQTIDIDVFEPALVAVGVPVCAAPFKPLSAAGPICTVASNWAANPAAATQLFTTGALDAGGYEAWLHLSHTSQAGPTDYLLTAGAVGLGIVLTPERPTVELYLPHQTFAPMPGDKYTLATGATVQAVDTVRWTLYFRRVS